MKITVFIIVILSLFTVHAQTYNLDSSFGNAGTKHYSFGPFHAKHGLLVADNYYLLSPNAMSKLNYSGLVDTAFGNNGLKSFTQSGESLTIVNFIFNNDFFYIFGKVANTSSGDEDIYICKIDSNGVYDTGFGTGGVLKLNFGAQESVRDIVIEPSGLYCIGTRFVNTPSASKMIIFKVNNNGTINTAFDLNGYKEISINMNTIGAAILPYNNSYMLVGSTKVSDYIEQILITTVDSSGNILQDFGTSGFKTIPLVDGGVLSNIVNNLQLSNNVLYINMNEALYISGGFNRLLAYNLANDQIVFKRTFGEYFYHQVENDRILVTSYCLSCCSTNPSSCNNVFNLTQLYLDGTTDSTFHIDGLYTYEFNYGPPMPNFGDSRSYLFIKDPNEKILIAGYMYPYMSSIFSAIKIVEGQLGTGNPEIAKRTVFYPNPVDDKIYLDTDEVPKSVELFDLSGRKIAELKFQYDEGKISMELSNKIRSGTYLLKIVDIDNHTVMSKIIKR